MGRAVSVRWLIPKQRRGIVGQQVLRETNGSKTVFRWFARSRSAVIVGLSAHSHGDRWSCQALGPRNGRQSRGQGRRGVRRADGKSKGSTPKGGCFVHCARSSRGKGLKGYRYCDNCERGCDRKGKETVSTVCLDVRGPPFSFSGTGGYTAHAFDPCASSMAFSTGPSRFSPRDGTSLTSS